MDHGKWPSGQPPDWQCESSVLSQYRDHNLPHEVSAPACSQPNPASQEFPSSKASLKAKRVEQACERCKQRKIKCDELAQCRNCIGEGLECLRVGPKPVTAQIKSDWVLNVVKEHDVKLTRLFEAAHKSAAKVDRVMDNMHATLEALKSLIFSLQQENSDLSKQNSSQKAIIDGLLNEKEFILERKMFAEQQYKILTSQILQAKRSHQQRLTE